MKPVRVCLLLLAICLMSACKDVQDLELEDLKNPAQDTIFFNLYSNVYSEDTALQTVRVGECIAGVCDDEYVAIKVPRVYFHSTLRLEDQRSFMDKQSAKVPRTSWPEFSTIEVFELLLSCDGRKCTSYPEQCNESKLQCAKPLRTNTLSLPDYLNLAKVEFLFYEQTGTFSIFNPRFVWREDELVETLAGGYKRFSKINRSKIELRDGGIYLPASNDDQFHRIQCGFKNVDCEYVFYLPLEENFAANLYADKDKPLLVKASFKNLNKMNNGFKEVNERLSLIKENLCQFIPCKT